MYIFNSYHVVFGICFIQYSLTFPCTDLKPPRCLISRIESYSVVSCSKSSKLCTFFMLTTLATQICKAFKARYVTGLGKSPRLIRDTQTDLYDPNILYVQHCATMSKSPLNSGFRRMFHMNGGWDGQIIILLPFGSHISPSKLKDSLSSSASSHKPSSFRGNMNYMNC